MSGTLPRLRDRLAVGKSALRVSPVCLGMVGSIDTIHAAFDAGVNFFFVSTDMHWPLYGAIRKGLEQLLERSEVHRDDLVVAGVSYMTQPEFCWQPFEELLEEVPGLDRIDLLVMGGAYGDEFERRQEVYQRNFERKLAGARALAASFHDRAAAAAAISAGSIDLVYIRYNPLHPGARDDLFPVIGKESSCRVFNFNSTHGQHLTGSGPRADAGDMWIPKVTDYYRFALSRDEIDGLLASLRNPAELTALSDALHQGPLSEEEQDYMIELVAAVADMREQLAGERQPG